MSSSKRNQRGSSNIFSQMLAAAEASNLTISDIDQAMYGKASPTASVVAVEDGSISLGDFVLSPVGLKGGDNATLDDWENLGKALKRLESGLQFLVGDWLLMGERRWGEKYRGAAEKLGYSEKSLREFTYVCRNVDLSIRMDKLSFKHHQIVAALNPEQQVNWLQIAATSNWSTSKLRAEINKTDDPITPDWWADWFMPKLDSLAQKARKATESERTAAANELRRLADELEGVKR